MFKIFNLNAWIDNKKILHNINIEVNPGEIILITGPNGSGKTTLARAILNDPKIKKEGKILLYNLDLTSLPPHEISKYVYLAFQYPPDIEFLLTKLFLEELKVIEKFEELKDFFNLPNDILERGVMAGLAGGERKKFEILLSMLRDYDVYIFDEPDSGLDVQSISKVVDILWDLKRRKKHVIVISHTAKLFERLKPDKVYLLEDGRIVREGGYEILNILDSYE